MAPARSQTNKAVLLGHFGAYKDWLQAYIGTERLSMRTQCKPKRRSCAGQQLIEVMVAVALSGFLAIIMGNSLAEILAASAKLDSRLKGQDITGLLVDRLRHTPYSTLKAATSATPYFVEVYTDDGTSLNSAQPFVVDPGTSKPLPCLMDTTSLEWASTALNSRLKGTSPNNLATAEILLTTTPLASDAVTATITVDYVENKTVKQYKSIALISRNGIHG